MLTDSGTPDPPLTTAYWRKSVTPSLSWSEVFLAVEGLTLVIANMLVHIHGRYLLLVS